MSPQEANDAVGKEWAAAKFSDGQVRAEGDVIGFSIVPMVCIKTRSGEKVWWRHDMVDVAERPVQSPRKLGDQVPPEFVGSVEWNVPGVTDGAPADECADCLWSEVRRLSELVPEIILVQPCSKHRRNA